MKILVTGGGGFLGKAVCARLLAAGHEVTSFSRNYHADLEVDQLQGDLQDYGTVTAAVAGRDAVVHCGAKAGQWGQTYEFYGINVLGTDHVIKACRENGVPRLVHTSSPSVVHNGQDLEGVDENAPYAKHFHGDYPRTKAEAEKRVLAANSPELATVALRPHLIWGPGDPHFLPRIIGRARAGRMRLIGPPGKRVDTIYIDNAADAHLLAVERLEPGSPIAGRAYFLTQDDPRTADETLNALLAVAGLPPETRRVPFALAKFAATVVEGAYRLAAVRAEPPLTRMVIQHGGTSHWFDISAARRDLGYHPKVSTEEGLRRLTEHLSARERA
ncbi:NAD-dependent epimerase/dehydratase family protein [Allokutzneria sp. A3M-2-11 16]|uniref:NAD-dependent epimerase/dehydratase family protein n=1 Tax=Allokutzneria sp. A3M-2-11 16 TaxID=2962043 RepID=UPI0020B7D442|nr:NAD-dependent epimerase/dehydratase family protein [Allokutzneria sp. A3M-2-11 16]MCP3804492.1 NAD-dependent epimerase/dehydratase family protein [Allokutzneria sp. A3M-2-11 16]